MTTSEIRERWEAFKTTIEHQLATESEWENITPGSEYPIFILKGGGSDSIMFGDGMLTMTGDPRAEWEAKQ